MDILIKSRNVNTTLLFYSDDYESRVSFKDNALHKMLYSLVSPHTAISITYYSTIATRKRIIISHFPENGNEYRCSYFSNGEPIKHTYDLDNVVNEIIGLSYHTDIWVKVIKI